MAAFSSGRVQEDSDSDEADEVEEPEERQEKSGDRGDVDGDCDKRNQGGR